MSWSDNGNRRSCSGKDTTSGRSPSVSSSASMLNTIAASPPAPPVLPPAAVAWFAAPGTGAPCALAAALGTHPTARQ